MVWAHELAIQGNKYSCRLKRETNFFLPCSPPQMEKKTCFICRYLSATYPQRKSLSKSNNFQTCDEKYSKEQDPPSPVVPNKHIQRQDRIFQTLPLSPGFPVQKPPSEDRLKEPALQKNSINISTCARLRDRQVWNYQILHHSIQVSSIPIFSLRCNRWN